jgi:hypothetical protein
MVQGAFFSTFVNRMLSKNGSYIQSSAEIRDSGSKLSRRDKISMISGEVSGKCELNDLKLLMDD